MTPLERPRMLGYLADAFHFDMTETRMRPLINAIFDKACDYSWAAKRLEVQLVVFPHGGRMRRAQAKRPWADVPWPNIERRFCRGMVMYDPAGCYDDTITTLFKTLHVVRQSGVKALPQAAKILCATR